MYKKREDRKRARQMALGEIYVLNGGESLGGKERRWRGGQAEEERTRRGGEEESREREY